MIEIPTEDDLIECWGMSEDGGDFKRVASERREAARELLNQIRGDQAEKDAAIAKWQQAGTLDEITDAGDKMAALLAQFTPSPEAHDSTRSTPK